MIEESTAVEPITDVAIVAAVWIGGIVAITFATMVIRARSKRGRQWLDTSEIWEWFSVFLWPLSMLVAGLVVGVEGFIVWFEKHFEKP